MGTVKGYSGYGGHSGYGMVGAEGTVGTMGAGSKVVMVEGRWVQWKEGTVHKDDGELYGDEGREVQIAAPSGGRDLGTCRNRLGDLV